MFLIIINCSNTLIGEHAWTKSNTTRLKNVQQSAKNYLCTILCHGQTLGEFLVLGVSSRGIIVPIVRIPIMVWMMIPHIPYSGHGTDTNCMQQ